MIGQTYVVGRSKRIKSYEICLTACKSTVDATTTVNCIVHDVLVQNENRKHRPINEVDTRLKVTSRFCISDFYNCIQVRA